MEETTKTVAQRDYQLPATKSGKPVNSRLAHLAWFWFVVYPLLTIVLGAYYTIDAPVTQVIPFSIALGGVFVGVLYLIPEFLVTAGILFLVSWLIFRIFPPAEQQLNRRYMFEPAIAFLGVCLGISLEYPAILSNPFFAPLQALPLLAGWLVMGSFLLLLAALRNGLHHRNLATVMVPVAAFITFGWGITQLPVYGQPKDINRGSTVLLGIDSMSLQTDVAHLQKFGKETGGAFYEKAVTPGLLTNSVWPAIIEHRPVHATGTTLILQTPDWNRSPYNLVTEAKNRGYQTWSYITTQNTTYVGSMAGFDHDRSGPMGWLTNATVGAKNGSIFVSFFVSRLPHIPFSRIRRNQEGTYAFDLRAVVHNILTEHEGSRPVFTVAHIGYLHDEAYPRMDDLSKADRGKLLSTRIESIRDGGTDWQILAVEGDPIDLRNWKYQNVQRVVTSELQRTHFLDPQNNNRLVILSDHGIRGGLRNDNFADPKYYQVVLITFGVPARDVRQPISLLDISSLVGLQDPTMPGPAAPVVEYINWFTSDEYTKEIGSAKWGTDGRVTMSSSVDKKYLGLLRSYDPYKMDATATNDDPKMSETTEEQRVSSSKGASAGGGGL